MKPCEIIVAMGRRAVVVEWRARKPCWFGDNSKASVHEGRMRRSSTFMQGESSEIGRYDVLSFTGLPGLSTGIIIALFQMAGISALETERLYNSVK